MNKKIKATGVRSLPVSLFWDCGSRSLGDTAVMVAKFMSIQDAVDYITSVHYKDIAWTIVDDYHRKPKRRK